MTYPHLFCYNFLEKTKNSILEKNIKRKHGEKMMIGRENERKKLQELYDSKSAEMVAVYGRRRVGKTFLIDEVFKGRLSFRHAGLSPIDDRYDDAAKRKSRMKDQLKHFHRSLVLA